jgi:hypothetical protein
MDQEAPVMPEQETDSPGQDNSKQLTDNIAGAHSLLQALQARIGEHPELGAAITKLEMALNTLAVKTGGML